MSLVLFSDKLLTQTDIQLLFSFTDITFPLFPIWFCLAQKKEYIRTLHKEGFYSVSTCMAPFFFFTSEGINIFFIKFC